MINDMEQLLDENLSLKKAYHVSRKHEDKLQQENNDLRARNADLEQKMASIADHNETLAAKTRKLQAQLANSSGSFVSQIEQLKSLIEFKERQLENLQLRMIPSLDQDMIRVKLIAEMEGPYQEAVDKKDREIARLRDQLHTYRREKEIAQYSLANKQRQLKKQLEETKQFYQSEIERTNRQMSHLSSKGSNGRIDKQIIKTYRAEIDQLRSTCQFHKNTEDELRKQLMNLRLEREKLVADLSNAHAHKAVELSINGNEGVVRELKGRVARLEDDLARSQEQLGRFGQKCKVLEMEKKKIEVNYEAQMKELKMCSEKQRQALIKQIEELRDEARKARQQRNRFEQQYSDLLQKYKKLMNENQRANQQMSSLRVRLNISEQNNTSSRYHKPQQTQRVLRERIQREIRQKIRIEQENSKKGESPRREDDTSKQESALKLKSLQQKNRKLSEKLQFANRKILELLRQKAQRSPSTNNDYGRSRSITAYPERDTHRLLLQNRDCSLMPLCPPVILQPLH